jgi:amino acid permease
LGPSSDSSTVGREIDQTPGTGDQRHLERGLGLFDSTMIVAGSMIGSGIFIVAGEMAGCWWHG